LVRGERKKGFDGLGNQKTSRGEKSGEAAGIRRKIKHPTAFLGGVVRKGTVFRTSKTEKKNRVGGTTKDLEKKKRQEGLPQVNGTEGVSFCF